MDLPDTNVTLGVHWLSTLGPITSNYKTMEISFNSKEGKRVTLKAMIENAPRVVSTVTRKNISMARVNHNRRK